jgi:hypothetical protein
MKNSPLLPIALCALLAAISCNEDSPGPTGPQTPGPNLTPTTKPFRMTASMPPIEGYATAVDAVTQASDIIAGVHVTVDSIVNPDDSVRIIRAYYGDNTPYDSILPADLVSGTGSFHHWYVRTDESKSSNICITRIIGWANNGKWTDTSIAVRVMQKGTY